MEQGYPLPPSPGATQDEHPLPVDGPLHGPDTPARAEQRAYRLAQAVGQATSDEPW